jgi:hypothetical protein
VAVRVMRKASCRRAPRVGGLREAQPFRHHRVDPVASYQYLQMQRTSILLTFQSLVC